MEKSAAKMETKFRLEATHISTLVPMRPKFENHPAAQIVTNLLGRIK